MSAAVREYRDLEQQWAMFLPQSLRKRAGDDELVLSALKLRELGLIGPHDVDDDEQQQRAAEDDGEERQFDDDDDDDAMHSGGGGSSRSNEVLQNLYTTPRTVIDRLLTDSYRWQHDTNNTTNNNNDVVVEREHRQHDKRAVEYARVFNQWHLQVIISAENADGTGGNVFTKSVLQLCKDLVSEIKAVPRYNVS